MSKKKERMKDRAWDKILKYFEDKNQELKNLIIASDQIKEITGKEPRILCKFDVFEAFPEPLKERNLFVLPIKNKYYQLVEGNGFRFLDDLPEVETENYTSKLMFEPQTAKRGSSESLYLDIASNSGLIEEFVGSKPLYLTIRGRKYSPKFSFEFNKTKLDVESVQVEVDAGFEGKEVIVLIEAKGKRPSSFNIRQLFYPYRFWSTLIDNKEIINIFFWYDKTDDTFHFCQYDFANEFDYNSIYLERYKKYRIKQFEIEDPKEITIRMIPQADDIEKIITLIKEVSEGFDDSQQIAERLNFTVRQSSYYRQATEILQFVSIDKNNKYNLTEKGLELIRSEDKTVNELVNKQIINIPIINKIVKKLFSRKDKAILFDEIVSFIIEETGLSETTARRRTQTLFSWFRWIEEKIGIFIITKKKLTLKTEEIKTLEDFL